MIIIGFVGQTILARPFKNLFNKLLKKIPLLKVIYSAFKDQSAIQDNDQFAVYFPHSYNWSGELVLVPRDLVVEIDIPPAEVMKFIVSAGVADWD